MSDIWDSFTEYVKTRLTNPFLATLIVVWIIRNFTFVFSLFNFDSGETREQKLEYIENYLSIHETWSELGWNVSISFSVIFSSFILLLVSRALTNGYSLALSFLNKHTAKSTMIEVEDHNKLLLEYANLKKERDVFRSEASSHDGQINDLVERLSSKTAELSIFESELAKEKNSKLTIENENENLKAKVENLEKEVKELLSIDESSHELIRGLPEHNDDGLVLQNFNPTIPHDYIAKELNNYSNRIIKNLMNFRESNTFKTLKRVQRTGLINIYTNGKLLELLYYMLEIYNDEKSSIYVDLELLRIYFEADFFILSEDHDPEESEAQYLQIIVLHGAMTVYENLIENTSFKSLFKDL